MVKLDVKQNVLLPIAFSFVFLSAIVGLFAYLIYLRPASPEAVCDNFYEVYETELEQTLGTDLNRDQVEGNLGLDQDECIEEEGKSRRESGAGYLEIVRVSKCQVNAEDFDAFLDCQPE